MNQGRGFLAGIERYARSLVRRSPLSYPYFVVSIAFLVVLLSLFGKNINSAINTDIAIKMAIGHGDYGLAEKLLNKSSNSLVLGAKSQIDDLVHPEKPVERKIEELEGALTNYPENREIYLQLANLYKQLGKTENAQEYLEKARVLDPNGEN